MGNWLKFSTAAALAVSLRKKLSMDTPATTPLGSCRLPLRKPNSVPK